MLSVYVRSKAASASDASPIAVYSLQRKLLVPLARSGYNLSRCGSCCGCRRHLEAMVGECRSMLLRRLVQLPFGEGRADRTSSVSRAEHAADPNLALGIAEDLKNQGVARPQPVQPLMTGRADMRIPMGSIYLHLACRAPLRAVV